MEKKGATRLRSIMIVTMILTGAFFVVSSGPVTAAQDGVYTYSVVNGYAIISAYTGAGGAVTIPSTVGGYTVTGIGPFAFNNAAGFSVTSVTIPNGVTSIDNYAFDGCSSLRSVTFGNGLVTIGNGAFEHCSGLTSVNIPNSVTKIGSWAFYTCFSISTLTLGSGLVSIGDYAFSGCTALVSLTIPNNVISIGTSAFDGCSSLVSAAISNKVKSLGSFAFYDCKSLSTVTIGSGIVSLGSSLFYGSAILTSITFTGLVAPTTVGSNWLPLNSFMIRGHAYAASNFPTPGNTFYGLMMGPTIDPVVPGAPTGLSTSPTDAQIVLTWSSSSSGGSSISDYRIYRGATSGGETYLGHTGSGSSLTYTDAGLINGQTYYYQVAAVNAYGEGPRCAEISGRPAVTASVPRDLIITAGDGQASFTWTVPSSIGDSPIDYYIVYQGGVDVKHPTGTSTIITGLNNGQTYSFTVAAHNSVGAGPRTAAVMTTPVTSKTVPSVPIGLTATAGNGQIALSWTAPSSNGGAAIDYYLVLVDGVARAGNYSTFSATVSGLTNGHQYSFTVSAHNIMGTSLQSAAVKSTPIAPVTVPGAPKNLTATPGDGQITFSWSTPSSNGGGTIDYYLIYVDLVAQAEHYSTNSATITGLINGRSYSFTIAAHNTVGIGAQSTAVISKSSATVTVPGVPTGPTAIPGDGQILLSWSAPVNNGGSSIDYYLVYVDGVARGEQYATTTATISGLTNSQSYSFKIVAHNIAGIGAQSTAVIAKPSATTTVPGVPTGLTATPGDGQVALSWDAPGSNGGAAIDHYMVYVDGTAIAEQYATRAVTIKDLTNGQSYVFTVSAHNSVGNGTRSTAVTSTPSITLTVPDMPTGLTAVPGDGQISLSWTAPSGNGGSEIDYYIVYQIGIDVSHLTTASETIVGLTNGQSYSFTVAAHNTVGVGSQTSSVSAIPSANITVPDVPVGLNAMPGDGQIELSWSAPGSNGGATIDYYVVYLEGVERIDHYVDFNAVITGLANGLQHNFTVAAHNSVGVGAQTSAVDVMPSANMTVPGIPLGLNITQGTGIVSLSWDPPGSNGGALIDYYIIYQDGIATYHVTDVSKTIVGLTNGQSYNFTVAAHNSVGMGENTSVVNAILPKNLELPETPTNLTVALGDGLVTISWDEPEGPGSSSIDYYLIYQNGEEVANVTGNLTTITGLTNGQSYDFTMVAHNSVGMGNKTSVVTVMLASRAEPPGPPTDLTITAGNGSLMISWTAPLYSGSFEIDYYVVYQNGVDAFHSVITQITIDGLTNDKNYTFEIAAHNPAGLGEQSTSQTAAPIGPNSNETGTISSTNQNDQQLNDIAYYIGAVLLLLAAISGIVFVIDRLRKKV